jgi:hypothetical protein
MDKERPVYWDEWYVVSTRPQRIYANGQYLVLGQNFLIFPLQFVCSNVSFPQIPASRGYDE